MMKRVYKCLLMLLVSGIAHAGTNCTVSTGGVAFGNYDPIANIASDVTGTITVTCTGTVGDTVSYTVSASTGAGTYSSRHMNASTKTLKYNLYMDSARTRIFGDGSSSTFTISDSYSFTSSTMVKNYTLYGRIPNAQTTASTGSYADNMVATVKW